MMWPRVRFHKWREVPQMRKLRISTNKQGRCFASISCSRSENEKMQRCTLSRWFSYGCLIIDSIKIMKILSRSGLIPSIWFRGLTNRVIGSVNVRRLAGSNLAHRIRSMCCVSTGKQSYSIWLGLHLQMQMCSVSYKQPNIDRGLVNTYAESDCARVYNQT